MRFTAPLHALVVTAAVTLTLAACSDDGEDTKKVAGGGANGSGASGTGGNGTGASSTGGLGTGAVSTGGIGIGGTGGEVKGCQEFDISFEPKIPTVYILVDRSGSMFDGPNPYWGPFKDAILAVVENLQTDIRFGFVSYTGLNGGTCPDLSGDVAPALDNFTQISSSYNALGRLDNGETPTAQALAEVRAKLQADSGATGEKYVMLVTDGDPDFCNNDDNLCPIDALVYDIQEAYKEGVNTLVFGIAGSTVTADTLQLFADAGAGGPVNLAGLGLNPGNVADGRCTRFPEWVARASGRDFAGEYASTGQGAPVFQPDTSNVEALKVELSSALSGVKGCEFDLSGEIQIDRAQLGPNTAASVAINGTKLAYDAANGWSVADDADRDVVVFNGAACQTWRDPASTDIAFDFPCEIFLQ